MATCGFPACQGKHQSKGLLSKRLYCRMSLKDPGLCPTKTEKGGIL
jgi:hypothetical protein